MFRGAVLYKTDPKQAVTEMVRKLRNGRGTNGLILANGGVLTYQHVICLSSQPSKTNKTYSISNPLPEKITDIPVPEITAEANGEAIIEVSHLPFYHVSNSCIDVHS
jgi:hypothetical protein